MSERSITSPSSQTAVPAQLCPPPRTATRSSCSRAKRNATTTSFSSAQKATKEGRRSIRPFQTFRAASYLHHHLRESERSHADQRVDRKWRRAEVSDVVHVSAMCG